jgi:heme oxygenase (mycobilin-producing)
MLIRIVKMTFQPGKTDDFLAIFQASQPQIRAFEGCTHLELWQDPTHPGIFFTHSHWESAEHLENYRQSALFQKTWVAARKLFSQKAEVCSLKKIY